MGWLSNLFKRRDNILEWYFSFHPSVVNIQTKAQDVARFDDLLMASYVLFLARYFAICENNQVGIARRCLLESIQESLEPNELTTKLHENIAKALSPIQKRALGKLSSIGEALPITYSEDEELTKPYARYSFFVFEGAVRLTSAFHMSTGPTIMLLPLTVGILYEYIVDKVDHGGNREKLDRTIIDLLGAHDSVNCRSYKGLYVLPVEIIAKNALG